jgi:hypothetical protein
MRSTALTDEHTTGVLFRNNHTTNTHARSPKRQSDFTRRWFCYRESRGGEAGDLGREAERILLNTLQCASELMRIGHQITKLLLHACHNTHPFFREIKI